MTLLNNTLTYKIKAFYTKQSTQNTIECRVVKKNGEILDNKISFVFNV
jgi:hypothetical protein